MAATSTLTDNFNDNSFDTGLWTRSNATRITETSQLLQYTTLTTGAYYDIRSNVTYDLTGSYIFDQVVSAGNQALTSLEVYPIVVYVDDNNQLFWLVTNDAIFAYKKVAGVSTDILDASYDSATHKYFRIRESGGTTFWDTSADGITWTNFTSQANPITVTAVQPLIQVGTWNTEASGTTVQFDNFNVAPVNTTDFFQLF